MLRPFFKNSIFHHLQISRFQRARWKIIKVLLASTRPKARFCYCFWGNYVSVYYQIDQPVSSLFTKTTSRVEIFCPNSKFWFALITFFKFIIYNYRKSDFDVVSQIKRLNKEKTTSFLGLLREIDVCISWNFCFLSFFHFTQISK